MTNTATRLITLIMLLQRQPNQNATRLAQELQVSVRTVQRYINMLDEMGIPVYAERGPHGGYSLVRGYKMPPLVFTPQEAVAIYLGANLMKAVWGPLYGESAQTALAKLDNVLPDAQRTEAARAQRSLGAMGLTQANQRRDAPYLQTLWTAVSQQRTVSMGYRSRNQPEPSTRDFDPYLLLNAWGRQYCLGYCHMRQAMRTFRVDRILDLTLLAKTFSIPVDFDLETYVANEPYLQNQVEVRLHFDSQAILQALDNRTQWDQLEEQSDGTMIATFAIADIEAAANIVMAYGYRAKVLEPDELRDVVYDRARTLAARQVLTE